VIYVHQQPYLFHTSVADNIAYGCAQRVSKRTSGSGWSRQRSPGHA
jgi:ABC-type multidrug transport system fused ATPase/permease subunit